VNSSLHVVQVYPEYNWL